MRLKILLITAAAVFTGLAQDITIRGTVTTSDSTALSGAEVMLKETGIGDTTGIDGSFSLTGTGINVKSNNSQPHSLSASTVNDVLYLNLRERSRVEIITYTLQGKIVYRVQKKLEAGTHAVKQPQWGAGVYIHKIKARFGELLVKSSIIDKISGSTAQKITSRPSTTLAVNKKNYSRFEDIIAVTKNGYLNYRVPVTNSDTSGIEVMMIDRADSVVDADGNVYNAVKIGDQVWTVMNLKTTKYNDGTDIGHITDNVEWETDTNGAYCYYGNTTDDDSIANFGALYNWYAVETGKLAPEGWHVPDSSDWQELEDYLIANGYNWDGTTSGNKIGKSIAARTDWHSSGDAGGVGNDRSLNNSTGFAALGGGYRSDLGNSTTIGIYGYYWSSTETEIDTSFAYGHHLCFDYYSLVRSSYYKASGFSVRLVRD